MDRVLGAFEVRQSFFYGAGGGWYVLMIDIIE